MNNYLVNTLLPVEFKKWVAFKLEERKQLIVLKRRFTVDVLPEFKAALLSSNSVSGSIYFSLSLLVSKGRSNFLLRSPKRKRGKYEEIKEVELIENDEYIKEVQYLAEISDLQSKIKEYKALQIEDAKYKEIVADLVEKGIISETGKELMKF